MKTSHELFKNAYMIRNHIFTRFRHPRLATIACNSVPGILWSFFNNFTPHLLISVMNKPISAHRNTLRAYHILSELSVEILIDKLVLFEMVGLFQNTSIRCCLS